MCEPTDPGYRSDFGQHAERIQRRRFGQPFVRRNVHTGPLVCGHHRVAARLISGDRAISVREV